MEIPLSRAIQCARSAPSGEHHSTPKDETTNNAAHPEARQPEAVSRCAQIIGEANSSGHRQDSSEYALQHAGVLVGEEVPKGTGKAEPPLLQEDTEPESYEYGEYQLKHHLASTGEA